MMRCSASSSAVQRARQSLSPSPPPSRSASRSKPGEEFGVGDARLPLVAEDGRGAPQVARHAWRHAPAVAVDVGLVRRGEVRLLGVWNVDVGHGFLLGFVRCCGKTPKNGSPARPVRRAVESVVAQGDDRDRDRSGGIWRFARRDRDRSRVHRALTEHRCPEKWRPSSRPAALASRQPERDLFMDPLPAPDSRRSELGECGTEHCPERGRDRPARVSPKRRMEDAQEAPLGSVRSSGMTAMSGARSVRASRTRAALPSRSRGHGAGFEVPHSAGVEDTCCPSRNATGGESSAQRPRATN